MPAVPAAILFGAFSEPLLMEASFTDNLEGVDTAELEFVTDSMSSFVNGTAPPGYPGMRIKTIRPKNDGGGVWGHVLSCYGLLNAKNERRLEGYPKRVINLADWDTVEDVWVSNNRRKFWPGQAGTYGGNMVCVSAPDEPVYGVYYKVTGRFQGILEVKPDQRTITCGGNQVSGDAIQVNLPGGGTSWTDYRKANVNLPRIVVTDRRLTTSPPPTHLVPGAVSPPNPPSIKAINPSGNGLTSNWPNGWSFTLESNQLASGLYDNRLIYEYVWYRTPS